jgi:hypothetical protein
MITLRSAAATGAVVLTMALSGSVAFAADVYGPNGRPAPYGQNYGDSRDRYYADGDRDRYYVNGNRDRYYRDGYADYGWNNRDDYWRGREFKEEYRNGNCKVERRLERDGRYHEEVNCEPRWR